MYKRQVPHRALRLRVRLTTISRLRRSGQKPENRLHLSTKWTMLHEEERVRHKLLLHLSLIHIFSQVKAGDALLVKASHGMALETILEGFYKQFQNTTGVSG